VGERAEFFYVNVGVIYKLSVRFEGLEKPYPKLVFPASLLDSIILVVGGDRPYVTLSLWDPDAVLSTRFSNTFNRRAFLLTSYS
jgi:hypothetical protein